MKTLHVPLLIEQIIRNAVALPGLRHIDPAALLVLVDRLSERKLGVNTPLRHGRSGPKYELHHPEVRIQGAEKLYTITITPKLLIPGQCGETSLVETVMHELWHVNTLCDGGLRRMRHGKEFDGRVKELEAQYVKTFGGEDPAPTLDSHVLIRRWQEKEPEAVRVRKDVRWLVRTPRLQWNESHLLEEAVLLKRFYKRPRKDIRYVCPNGHIITTKIRFKKPRSCSKCSRYFDRRYEFREVLDL